MQLYEPCLWVLDLRAGFRHVKDYRPPPRAASAQFVAPLLPRSLALSLPCLPCVTLAACMRLFIGLCSHPSGDREGVRRYQIGSVEMTPAE